MIVYAKEINVSNPNLVGLTSLHRDEGVTLVTETHYHRHFNKLAARGCQLKKKHIFFVQNTSGRFSGKFKMALEFNLKKTSIGPFLQKTYRIIKLVTLC
jgi:hypothetical protein